VAFITTVNIYDNKGRVIQTQSNNITGGANVNTIQYSWLGQPLVSVVWQSKLGARPDTSITVTKMTYDNLNRLVKTEMKQSNSKVKAGAMPANYTTLSQIQYDAIGQVKTKYLGNRKNNETTYNSTPLEKQYYEYNVRGWLLGLNRAYTRDAASTDSVTTTMYTQTIGGEMFTEGMSAMATVTYPNTNYFGFDLGYDRKSGVLIKGKSYTAAEYTGNISGMAWKGANDKKVRIYNFTYDNASRLTAATFGQYSSGGFSSANVNCTVNGLTYDNNGNIKTMKQYGLKTGSTSGIIDQLSYNYASSTSNKLKNVIDAANDANSTLGDFHYSGTKTTATLDYEYDANGNLHLDHNKHLTITYNSLNLPQDISVTGKGVITYIYDAIGNKLMKITVDNSVTPPVTTSTLYLGASVYQNDTLQFFATSEDRLKPNMENTAFIYDYFLKDHLGNTRMVITDDYNVSCPILETISYYPFGLQQRGIGLTQETTPLHNKYTYNGKELQEDLGLDEYDYGARFYDAQIGRWVTQDPLSEIYENQGPYNYAINNPILMLDADGMATDTGGKSLTDVTVVGHKSMAGGIAIPLTRTLPRVEFAPIPPPNPFLVILGMVLLPANWNSHQSSCELCGIQRLHAEAKQAEQEKTWEEDILNKAKKQPPHSGSSKAEQHTSEGGYKQADEDFEKLNPSNVMPLRNPNNNGKVGTLEDGSKIIVREKSSEGSATLERQFPNGSVTKIRYEK